MILTTYSRTTTRLRNRRKRSALLWLIACNTASVLGAAAVLVFSSVSLPGSASYFSYRTMSDPAMINFAGATTQAAGLTGMSGPEDAATFTVEEEQPAGEPENQPSGSDDSPGAGSAESHD